MASAAVERRKASGLPSIARFRAPRPAPRAPRIGRRQRLSVWRGHWLDAPLGAPLPSFLGGQRIKRTLLLSWYANLGRASRRENEFLLSAPAKRGRGTTRSVVEGASGSDECFFRRAVCFVANAPPTAQVRGPPSPLSRGGMKGAERYLFRPRDVRQDDGMRSSFLMRNICREEDGRES